MRRVPAEFKHGKSGYSNYRCRCTVCDAAIRSYRDSRRDEVADYQKSYREIHREELRDQAKAYHAANREQRRQKDRAYYAANRDARVQKQAQYNDRNRSARAARARHENKVTKSAATHHGERWTKPEDRLLADTSLSALELAYMTGRSAAAVACRRRKISRQRQETTA